eukprot:g3295.t1
MERRMYANPYVRAFIALDENLDGGSEESIRLSGIRSEEAAAAASMPPPATASPVGEAAAERASAARVIPVPDRDSHAVAIAGLDASGVQTASSQQRVQLAALAGSPVIPTLSSYERRRLRATGRQGVGTGAGRQMLGAFRSKATRSLRYYAKELIMLLVFYTTGGIFFRLVEDNHMSVLDAVYFITVSVTTIGYGDFAPKTTAGKLFSIVYFGVGLVFVGKILTDFGQYLAQRMEAHVLREIEQHEQRQRELEAAAKKAGKPTPAVHLQEDAKSAPFAQTAAQLAGAVWQLLACIVGGTIFYALSEGYLCDSTRDGVECWSGPVLGRSLYFTIVTITTVGYGDVTPLTRRAKATTIVFILIATVCFSQTADKVGQILLRRAAARRKRAFLAMKLDVATILSMDKDGDGEGNGQVDTCEFLLHGLVMQGKLEADDPDVESILADFAEKDEDGSGSLERHEMTALMQKMNKASDKKKSQEDEKSARRREREAASALDLANAGTYAREGVSKLGRMVGINNPAT